MTPDELRHRRQALGLSQERLGSALGVSTNTIARWERGEQRLSNPTLVRLGLDQLAHASTPPGSTGELARKATPPLSTGEAAANDTLGAEGGGGQLPTATASFVGRRAAVRILRRLCARQRLVTLAGPAGVGKTRLALEVAAQLAISRDQPRTASWLIELAPITEPAQVAQAVAGRLRIPERPGHSPLETLVEVLADQKVRLVLDNCEHLIDACGELVDALLRGCAGVHVLITSRQPLGIEGEQVYGVPPLALPDDDAAPVDEILRCEAVALFVERARSVQPGFALTADNAAIVAEVCRRLDGLPLALELAAARTRVLGPAQLLERLTDRFRLLRVGQRRNPPHHQALETTLDWSYALLSEAERQLFQRLSIFTGGFTLEAAEAICADESLPRAGVLALLARLVESSLVVAEPAPDGRGRYRLLETLREYASERLRMSGDDWSLAKRHCDWCIALAEGFDRDWRGPDQATWFSRIDQEHANLVAAIRWCLESGELERGLTLAGAAWRFWEVRGYVSEGRRWLARLLDQDGPGTRARARALDAAGHLAILQDDQATGMPLVQRSLELARELDDRRAQANAFHSLGLAAQYRADYPLAEAMHTASLELSRGIADTPCTYVAIYNLAVVAQKQNHLDLATALHEESLALKRAAGDRWSVGYSLFNLGLLASIRGDSERATSLVQDSLRLRHELGDKPGIAACLETLAEFGTRQRRTLHAARVFGAADALLQTIGVRIFTPRQGGLPRGIEAVRAQFGNGPFTRAYSNGWTSPLDRVIADALGTDAELATNSAHHAGHILTHREQEVAALIADGLTNRQIAARLTMAEGTAQRHVANIMSKLGFASRAEVAAWSVLQGRAD